MFYFWVALLIVLFLVALCINPWAAVFIGVLSLWARG